jgi:hypothetical protein
MEFFLLHRAFGTFLLTGILDTGHSIIPITGHSSNAHRAFECPVATITFNAFTITGAFDPSKAK